MILNTTDNQFENQMNSDTLDKFSQKPLEIVNKVIKVPHSVKVHYNKSSNSLFIESSKGKLSTRIPPFITLDVLKDSSQITISFSKKGKRIDSNRKALLGTLNSKILRGIKGVTQGFRIQLNLVGVGYRAILEDGYLVLKLGYSHDIKIKRKANIEISVNKRTSINLKGIDYELLTRTAAKIRSYRLPEVYKGKGIFYKGEVIQLKEGKKN